MRELLPYLLPFITLAGGWFYGKRRRKALSRIAEAKADSSELDAVERAIAIWRGLAKEFQEEVEKLRTTVDEFRVENEKLRYEVDELRLENEKLRLEVKGLREELQSKKI